MIGVSLLLSKNRILNIFRSFRSPKVDILSQHLKLTKEKSNSVVYVDVRLYNNGGPGAITVWVELLQGKNAWKRSLRFHLEPKQTQDITFRISETELSIDDEIYHRIWIE